MSEKGFDDHDECTIEEEEQERLMLVELPPKKSEHEKIIDGVDTDTGGQTSVFLHLRGALCLLWTIVQFLMALVGVYHLSSLNIPIRSGGHEWQTYNEQQALLGRTSNNRSNDEGTSNNTSNDEVVGNTTTLEFMYLPSGKWIRDPDKKHFAPICCGWEKAQYLEHPDECGTFPMPMGGKPLYQGRKDFLAHTGGHGCTCTDFHDEFTWVDDDLPLFNATQTCQKLKDRRVLMIGDSTMLQTASTLMNTLFPAGCQTQLSAMYGDTLVGTGMGGYNRGKKWVDGVKRLFTNTTESGIVILSAGPHVFNRSNFEIVINSVIEGSKDIKQTNPNIQIVWKTQQAAGCTQNISSDIYSGNDYNHEEFYERDVYAMTVLPQHGIHIIDMRMLYYRSDAHRSFANDCLHFCVPGPLDVIAPLFSQLLDRLS
jgi:hypothetical protein